MPVPPGFGATGLFGLDTGRGALDVEALDVEVGSALGVSVGAGVAVMVGEGAALTAAAGGSSSEASVERPERNNATATAAPAIAEKAATASQIPAFRGGGATGTVERATPGVVPSAGGAATSECGPGAGVRNGPLCDAGQPADDDASGRICEIGARSSATLASNACRASTRSGNIDRYQVATDVASCGAIRSSAHTRSSRDKTSALGVR